MGKSLLPDVKAEFIDLLEATPNLGDIQISYGHPGADLLEHESVWIGETEDWEQDWAKLGAQQRTEDFDLIVRFLAAMPGQDARESEARIFEFFEYVQDVVVDQANFLDLRGGRGRQLISIILAPKDMTPYVGNQGRVASITAALRVHGSI